MVFLHSFEVGRWLVDAQVRGGLVDAQVGLESQLQILAAAIPCLKGDSSLVGGCADLSHFDFVGGGFFGVRS